ncbi:MAG: SurA N-terminal domain-containing protein [Muribaculaceae bacterium]|nr:SurA N-terminal domain-containing protein [Muribaculaceae bacterium]
MATLEKIRNKSVLLFVIIIVALLAFILGDFLTSGRTYFGHPSTVASVDGVTVDYTDYQNRISQANEQMRNQGREISGDVLSQNVLQGIITEKLFQKEYDDLGITVTDAELTDALTGATPTPQAAQMIAYLAQQLNLPEASGRVVFDAVQNPAKYNLPASVGNELRAIWASQEKDVENSMLQQKFMRLLTGLYTYNKLDAKSYYDDQATTRAVAYVSKDISAVADDEIEFSDADIKALWESEKQNYELDEPMREVDYIYVAIEPSQADRIAGQQAVENAIVGLNATPGTDAVASDTKFSTSTQNVPASAIRDTKLREFVTSNEPGTAKLINRTTDTYTIAKLLDATTGIDSVNVSILRAAQTVDFDSLAAAINGGASFASLNSDQVQTVDSIWTSLEGTGIDATTRNAIAGATIDKAFVLTDSVQGAPVSAIYRVNKRNAPVKFYDVAVIEYTVDPSQETLTELSSNLRTYISNNSSADEFTKNAGEAGYSVMSDQVGPSSVGIGDVRDSRRFVKWATENKKGKVSPIMQDDRQTYLMAIAVKDVYNDYLPWTSPAINTQLAMRARNNKKAEKLLADYAGKANDLQGYAKLMGDSISNGNVNITTPSLLNIGVGESALQGNIAATEKGKFAGPLKGNRGILVYQVEDVNMEGRPFNERDYGSRFNQTFGIIRQGSPLPLLLVKDKVDNRSLNFVQSLGED